MNPEQLAKGNSEHGHQVALFAWMAQNFDKYPQLKLCFAIPNGGERNKAVAANLKAEGVRSGVPDIFLPAAIDRWHGLFIEMKRPKTPTQTAGTLSSEQKIWIPALKELGYGVVVAYTWEQARDFILQYLNWKG
jgi:hypothetical protein